MFSRGLENTRVSEEYSRAVILAESKLAEVGVMEPLTVADLGGETEDGFRWSAQISEHEWVGETEQGILPMHPYRITVNVSWDSAGRERQVELATLRIAGD